MCLRYSVLIPLCVLLILPGFGKCQAWKDLFQQAMSLHKQAKNDSAITIGKMALKIAVEENGRADTSVAMIYGALSNCFYVKADYGEAERLRLMALEIAQNSLGEESGKYLTLKQGLADVYQVQARYAEAENCYLYALEGFEQMLGPGNKKIAYLLTHIAQLYRRTGRLAEAERRLRRALSIWEHVPDPDLFSISQSYHQLALVYRRQGRLREAIALEKQALELREKAFGPEHYEVASSVNDLANFFNELGEYSEAESLQLRSLATMTKIFGDHHPWVAFGMCDLASIYMNQGRYAEAEHQSLQALSLIENALGQDHPDAAMIHNTIGTIYTRQSRYQAAEMHFSKAMVVREAALGEDHYYLAQTLEDYSEMLLTKGDYCRALELSEKACAIRRGNFCDNAIILTEGDALLYSIFLRKSLSNYLSCYLALDSTDPEIRIRVTDMIFSVKGQVSDEIFERQKNLVKKTDSVSMSLMDELKTAKLQLLQLYVKGSGEDYQKSLNKHDSLKLRVGELERSLSQRSVVFRKHQESKEINNYRIASLMPPHSILIEYLKFHDSRLSQQDTSTEYLAVVLGSEGEVRLIDLGKGAYLDTLINRYHCHMTRISSMAGLPSESDHHEYQEIAGDLYNMIWEPVEEFTVGKNLIFVAPDAGLNLVSFAALVDSNGIYLIEKIPIHYLSAGRDLIRLDEKARQGSGMFALGAPDFNSSANNRFDSGENSKDRGTQNVSYQGRRNIAVNCVQQAFAEVTSLPLARYEIEEIVKTWREVSSEPVIFYTDAGATETCFKNEATGFRVIHIATHGYFIDDVCQHRSIASDGDRFIGDNPLLLSGLFLAGANLYGEDKDGKTMDDGILTAYEISAMDLNGTDIVVLSACETGRGGVKDGEGVYGLRRAFQMAGARSVISSLWAVSDRYTAKFMSQLYSCHNAIMPEKIREIQIAGINELRSKGFSDHPVKWGSFTVCGDWR